MVAECFIQNRYDELAAGGVWINRDVVGPFNKEKEVYLWLSSSDGDNDVTYKKIAGREALVSYLASLSTYVRFSDLLKILERRRATK